MWINETVLWLSDNNWNVHINDISSVHKNIMSAMILFIGVPNRNTQQAEKTEIIQKLYPGVFILNSMLIKWLS